MEKYTGSEDFGPSNYGDNFDFDFDFRLKPFDYFLVILYVLFVFPLAWMRSRISPQKSGSLGSENLINKDAEYQTEFFRDIPRESYCLWPRHSHQ
jgi:hypothetical protein